MITRALTPTVIDRARHAPVVVVTGPRQSGKTTLCRALFPDVRYVSLEPLDAREAARDDPRGFLEPLSAGAVIDEVQHVPELLSYLQEEVDADPRPGRFVLTGSQHFGLLDSVTQSLAGRSSIVNLLPLSYDEILRFDDPPMDLWEVLWTGGYPRIHDRGVPPDQWLGDYITTYVERDVRQVLAVTDLTAYSQFVSLCAGRTACEVNLSALGADAGVSHNTARDWLSVLETGFLCWRAPAWRSSIRKQQIKAPKLHFVDSGLACRLLGITTPEQLRLHPLRGAVFETWVASEIYKARANRGLAPRLAHYRDPRLEVDIVLDSEEGLTAIECKSGSTLAGSFFGPIERFAATEDVRRVLAYGGDQHSRRRRVDVRPWSRLHELHW